MPVGADRFNLFAHWHEGSIARASVFSTHTDCVPPFIPSSEDATRIFGRGACDAKGISPPRLPPCCVCTKRAPARGCFSWLAKSATRSAPTVANQNPRGSRFLVNGEPTDNRIALASKGALRVEVIASGKMAHSAYPELGESAIDKLLDALQALRSMSTAR